MTINLTKYDKKELFREFEDYLKQKEILAEKELAIPVSVFSEKLSPLETVAKYLVENLNIKYSEIGRVLKKERQVIWTTYKRASEKIPHIFDEVDSDIVIPLSVLCSEKFSIAELIVAYLKENLNMKNSEISLLLKKDARTIWTFYKRYLKKKNG